MVSSNAYPRIPTDLTNFGDTALDALPRSSVVGEQVEEHETDPDGLRLRAPRSLPPWIDSYEERYGPVGIDQLQLLSPPARTVQAQHVASPAELQRRVSKDGFVDWEDRQLGPAQTPRAKIPHFLRYGRASMRGRKWDHLRTAEPIIVSGFKPSTTLSSGNWQDFIKSSAWGQMENEDAQIVDYSELEKLQPNFDRPVNMTVTASRINVSKSKRTLAKRLWILVMRHSLSPLLFRGMVMLTSMIALGTAARIYQYENSFGQDSAERTQSIVAVAVDTIAIPYLAYMIWDEYTGKPIGLRSAKSKMSLILLDLFFIILKSASTALAFESIVYHDFGHSITRHLSEALAAFQLIGLISWSMTFSVNIFRTVEKLGGGDDDG